MAWLLYPVDHEDRLAPHGLNNPYPPRPELGLWWAQGFINYEGGNSENTNTALLLDPQYAKLGPYTKSAEIYKCPSDKERVKIGRSQWLPRVRSVSMNAYVGGLGMCGIEATPILFAPQKQSEIRAPSGLFVFIDEPPDSLDFVSFWVETGAIIQGQLVITGVGQARSMAAAPRFRSLMVMCSYIGGAMLERCCLRLIKTSCKPASPIRTTPMFNGCGSGRSRNERLEASPMALSRLKTIHNKLRKPPHPLESPAFCFLPTTPSPSRHSNY